jgi:hypothetical protein
MIFFYCLQGAEDKPKSSADPFDDDDADKLAAIAKGFEDKYNVSSYSWRHLIWIRNKTNKN